MLQESVKSVEIWMDIEYQSGNKMRKNFTDVRTLAKFLKENPGIAQKVNYVRKENREVN